MITTWKGFSKPTTTPVPDELFDIWLSELTGSELKVLLYIVRRTFGFKKDDDTISLSQICTGITTRDGRELDQGTGLARNTASKAVKTLETLGLIRVQRSQDINGENEINTYRLRFQAEDEIGSEPNPPPELNQRSSENEPGVVRKSNYPGSKNDLPLVRKSNPQQTVLQETDPQQTEIHQTPPPLTAPPRSAALALKRTAGAGGDNTVAPGRSRPHPTPIHPPPSNHSSQPMPVREERRAAVETLVAFGVWRSRAGPLVDRLGLTAADADRACAALRAEVRQGATIANQGAVLAARLEAGWEPPLSVEPPNPHEEWSLDEADQVGPLVVDDRPTLPPVVRADGTEQAAYGWFEQLKSELQLQLARETYDTWIRPAKLVGHEVPTESIVRILTIRLHSLYAHRWVQERLHKVILRQAKRMLGDEVEIRYVAAGNENVGAEDETQAVQPVEKERNANGRAGDYWTGYRIWHDQGGGGGRQTGLLRVASGPRRVHPLPGGHRRPLAGQRPDPARY